MKPARKEIKEAIETAQLWAGARSDDALILFNVKKLRDLARAASWALELVDVRPPITPEELKRMKPRAKK